MDHEALRADDNWSELTRFFPARWEEIASESGAIRRLRGFDSPATLMRTLLLHIACGYSLRETAVQARAADWAAVSDVALLKRLRSSAGWLRALCLALLQEQNFIRAASPKSRILRVTDTTVIQEPGPKGGLWRLLYCLRLPEVECDAFDLTLAAGAGTGDSFRRLRLAPGELILGDRGFCTVSGIEHVAQSGADVLVRINSKTLPLYDSLNHRLDLLATARLARKAGRAKAWPVVVKAPGGDIRGRLCVLRKPADIAARDQRKLHRKAQRKSVQFKKSTYELARFILVFTTLPEAEFNAAQVLELYRLRWQIELVFKRLKTLARLGHLPKHDEASARAWLYGKLFVALLAHKLTRLGRDFSPWGHLSAA